MRLLITLLLLGATLDAGAASCSGRIVSLGGDVTEIVYALGLGDCVVADDTTSTYPDAAQQRPKVGYLRALNAEGVLSLKPTLIVGSADAGPPQVVAQLRSAGAKVALFDETHSVAGTLDKIHGMGALFGQETAAAKLAASVESQLQDLQKTLSNVKRPARVLFIMSASGGSPLAAGKNTAATAMIALAGGVNVVDAYDGYKPLSPESLAALAPDTVVIMSNGLDAAGGKDAILNLPGMNLTPAGRNKNVIVMEGSYLLGFGPRVVQAAHELAGHLYPSLVVMPSHVSAGL